MGFVSQTLGLTGPGSYSLGFDNIWSSYPKFKEWVTVLIVRIYRNLPWKPRALSLLINISNIIQKDTCTLMFKVALFTTDKTCKQSKCPSTDEWIKKVWCVCMCGVREWIKKMWCVCTMEHCCCSATKSRLTLCGPVDCSTPGLPILHYLSEFAAIHVHCVNDAI